MIGWRDSRHWRLAFRLGVDGMADPSKIDRKKIYIGVFFLCAGILVMLAESSSPIFRAIWMLLLGVGIVLYVWGRFFSRGPE
jgi:hypothetical protein